MDLLTHSLIDLHFGIHASAVENFKPAMAGKSNKSKKHAPSPSKVDELPSFNKFLQALLASAVFMALFALAVSFSQDALVNGGERGRRD